MQSEEIEFEQYLIQDDIPKVPCVYCLMNDIELCYVGQTTNLKNRIGQHISILNANIYLGDKLVVPNAFDSVYYFVVSDKNERRRLEARLIEEYYPKWNYEGMFSGLDYRSVHPDFRPNLNKPFNPR